jgi:putative flippase GtrA
MKITALLEKLIVISSTSVALQAWRYTVVGLIATVFDFCILVFLVEACGIGYLVANIFGFTVGTLVNYLLCVIWVFPNRNLKSKSAEFTVFVIVGIGGLGISEACMYLGVEMLGIHYTLTKIISVFFTFLWNFSFRKILLFRNRKTA